MRKSKKITHISWEEFQKLNLTGYEGFKHYKDDKGNTVQEEETGEWLIDSRGDKHYVSFRNYYFFYDWKEVKLNDVVQQNILFSEANNFKNRCICVALHTEPSEDEVSEVLDEPNNKATSIEEAVKQLLFQYSFRERFCFPKTYSICCDIDHLYSKRRKFCSHSDYYELPKDEVKHIFLVHY